MYTHIYISIQTRPPTMICTRGLEVQAGNAPDRPKAVRYYYYYYYYYSHCYYYYYYYYYY